MEYFEVEEYTVTENGHTFSVLVFPFVEHMWVYDDEYPTDRMMVDGSIEVFQLLSYAMAILIISPEKIIYFPCRKSGAGRYYNVNYDLILCTPKAQLPNSSWIHIRKKLDSNTKNGSLVLQYDRKTLDDFCEKRFLELYDPDLERCVAIKSKYGRKIKKEHQERVEGTAMIWVLGKAECYCAHYHTARDIDEMNLNGEHQIWSWFGWYLPPKTIHNLYKEDANDPSNGKESQWNYI